MPSLNGTRAIVIGGSSGIGLASGLALLDAGAAVIVTGRSEAKLKDASAQSAGRLATHAFDASVEANVKSFFVAQAPFDHLVLCANAGGAIGPFGELDLNQVRTYFDNKLWVYLMVLRHAPAKLRPGGSITLINGAASRLAAKNMAALAVTNGGLDSMIRPLALELAPTRVNAIAPGVIDTPYWSKMPVESRQAMYASAAAQVPVKRVGTAQDIAEAVVFLAKSSFITGIVVDVDGGRRLVP
jgi:NAD(P)-dependent dehydrogenase (short-subunit alcohol dehydrogenase family)